jgi:hypothetical protein
MGRGSQNTMEQDRNITRGMKQDHQETERDGCLKTGERVLGQVRVDVSTIWLPLLRDRI